MAETPLNKTATYGWHFHRWTKWEQYVETGVSYGFAFAPRKEGVRYSERRQKRFCVICNKMQDELVS